MSGVVIVATLYPKPEKIEQVKEGLQKLAKAVEENEPEALVYQIFEANGEITVLEKYSSLAAFEAHRNAPYHLEAQKAAAEQDGFLQPPLIKVLPETPFAGFSR